MKPWIVGGIIVAILLLKKKTQAAYYNPSTTSNAIVPGGVISSPYLKFRGYREDGSEIYHQGIDIKAPKDTPIRAVNNGVIEKIWLDGQVYGYGNLLLIYHNDGTSSLYAHLNSFGDIYEGMPINKGEIIGFVGQTQAPRSEMKTAPHLHLEILAKHTKLINPDTPERLNPVTYIKRQGMVIG